MIYHYIHVNKRASPKVRQIPCHLIYQLERRLWGEPERVKRGLRQLYDDEED